MGFCCACTCAEECRPCTITALLIIIPDVDQMWNMNKVGTYDCVWIITCIVALYIHFYTGLHLIEV